MKFGWLLFPSMFIIFGVFFKIGLVFFGGGYVVLPVIHRELVTNLHLLTEREFIDGTAISQLTPGPIAIIATFAGFIIANVWGALIATFAMFLPGSTLMFFISKNYDKIKNSVFAIKVLNTVIPVIVGLLIVTSWQIAQTTIDNKLDLAVLIISFILLVRFKINPAVLIISVMFLGILFKTLY
jgi:chromate transporter